jgi:hypothetical protein
MSAKSFRCAFFQLAGTGGNVWTLSVLPKFGKKFLLRFFSAGGNRRKCGDSFSLAKIRQKVFVALFFSWREPEEM